MVRANLLPGPSSPPKALVSIRPGTRPAAREAAPIKPREEKTSTAAAPPAVEPASPATKASPPAEMDKKAKDRSDHEKPVTTTALAAPEKKPEIPEVKKPQPEELQKSIKDSLVANGFSSLVVRVLEGKGVIISGYVKNPAQKNKVIQLVNSLGLPVAADYTRLKVVREAVGSVKKKIQEGRPKIHPAPEAPLRSAPEFPGNRGLPDWIETRRCWRRRERRSRKTVPKSFRALYLPRNRPRRRLPENRCLPECRGNTQF